MMEALKTGRVTFSTAPSSAAEQRAFESWFREALRPEPPRLPVTPRGAPARPVLEAIVAHEAARRLGIPADDVFVTLRDWNGTPSLLVVVVPPGAPRATLLWHSPAGEVRTSEDLARAWNYAARWWNEQLSVHECDQVFHSRIVIGVRVLGSLQSAGLNPYPRAARA